VFKLFVLAPVIIVIRVVERVQNIKSKVNFKILKHTVHNTDRA